MAEAVVMLMAIVSFILADFFFFIFIFRIFFPLAVI